MSMTHTEIFPRPEIAIATQSPPVDSPSQEKGTLFCENIAPLPLNAFQAADRHLMEMMEALRTESVDSFNASKRQLVSLLKKYGEPITQWNPLLLEFTDSQCLQGKQFPNINLEMVSLRSTEGPISLAGSCLQGASMLCANLDQAILTGTELSGVDMRFVSLMDGNLKEAVLIETNLGYANLCGADLERANLYRARMKGATLKQANFQEANLRKADLRNTDCYQADFRTARLQYADLREANLFMADLAGARLRYSDLRSANLGFSRLSEARLQHARLCDANMSSADLTRADLRNCRLNGVDLSRALVKDANLAATQLAESDLADCQALESANLQNAIFDDQTHFPQDFQPQKHGLNYLQLVLFRKVSRFINALLG
ncbi:pentapeptide repeat-containing protein [Vampirovibrio sp.]|uniref:pentapeptide repeat-containing protein n=1 Tax=Vampirovibrio sp. TaxID=2717857 RepID=UPI003594504F